MKKSIKNTFKVIHAVLNLKHLQNSAWMKILANLCFLIWLSTPVHPMRPFYLLHILRPMCNTFSPMLIQMVLNLIPPKSKSKSKSKSNQNQNQNKQSPLWWQPQILWFSCGNSPRIWDNLKRSSLKSTMHQSADFVRFTSDAKLCT